MSIAYCYASGHEKHWVGYVDVTEGSAPLRSHQGDIVTFADADPPVTSIRGLTMMVKEPVLYAVDGEVPGRIWKINSDDPGAGAEHVATMPAGAGLVNHAVRDGDYPVIYVSAGDETDKGGLYKFFPYANIVKLMKAVAVGERGLMVGYAGLTGQGESTEPDPNAPAEFIMSGSVNLFGIRHHTPQAGYLNKTGNLPMPYRYWRVTANPKDPKTWMTWISNNAGHPYVWNGSNLLIEGQNFSPLFITKDAGATWVNVALSFTFNYEITSIGQTYTGCWSHDGTRFCLAFDVHRPFTWINNEEGNLNSFGVVALVDANGQQFVGRVAGNPRRATSERWLNVSRVYVGPISINHFALLFGDTYGFGAYWGGHVDENGIIRTPSKLEPNSWDGGGYNGFMGGFIDSKPNDKTAHIGTSEEIYTRHWQQLGTNSTPGFHWEYAPYNQQGEIVTPNWGTNDERKGEHVAALVDALVFGARNDAGIGSGILYGSEVHLSGLNTDTVYTDRQTHTVVLVESPGINEPIRILQNGEWTEVPWPSQLPSGDPQQEAIVSTSTHHIEPIVGGPGGTTGGGGGGGGGGGTGGPPVGGTGKDQKFPTLTWNPTNGQLYWGWARKDYGGMLNRMTIADPTKIEESGTMGSYSIDPGYFNMAIWHSGDYLATVTPEMDHQGEQLLWTIRSVFMNYSQDYHVLAGNQDFAHFYAIGSDPTDTHPTLVTVAWRDNAGTLNHSTNDGSGTSQAGWNTGFRPDGSPEPTSYRGKPSFKGSAKFVSFSDNGAIKVEVLTVNENDDYEWATEAVRTDGGAFYADPSSSVNSAGQLTIAYRNANAPGVYASTRTAPDTYTHETIAATGTPSGNVEVVHTANGKRCFIYCSEGRLEMITDTGVGTTKSAVQVLAAQTKYKTNPYAAAYQNKVAVTYEEWSSGSAQAKLVVVNV